MYLGELQLEMATSYPKNNVLDSITLLSIFLTFFNAIPLVFVRHSGSGLGQACKDTAWFKCFCTLLWKHKQQALKNY